MSKRVSLILGDSDEAAIGPYLDQGSPAFEVLRHWASEHDVADDIRSEAAALHGKSECAYSGLNDNFVLGHPVPDEDGFSRTQSWGQVGKEGRAFLTSIGLNPGIACNPSKAG